MIMTLDQLLAQMPEGTQIPTLIGYIIGSLLIAFFGFRLFKLSVVLTTALAGFALGFGVFGTALGDMPNVEIISIVLGIACAIVGGLVAIKLFKAMIYFLGGMLGACLGFLLPYAILEALGQEIIGIIVGIVVAIVFAVIGAKLMFRFYKAIVIIDTAFTGASGMLSALAMLIAPGSDGIYTAVVIGTLILGVLFSRFQFKRNQGRELFQ